MKHDPRENIERLFHEARELKGEDRERFLSQECGGDSALRRTIEKLLAEDENSETFLDTPMLDLISTTLSPGTMLGPYEVLGVAGIGAMGQVYRAHDRRLSRDVAIKALPAEFTLAGEPLARLQREATLLASVNHPNVAAIYDVLERDLADSFLILEYVEGPTLAERLGQGPVPLAETLRIAHQIALALEAAHDKGIVHRDLKPANIKLTPKGIVKVLDFGLAKVFTVGLKEADPSAVGLVRNSSNTTSGFRGTPAYMSPEQVVGTAVDHRADIWAFGCIVFELLTGRRAFEENTVSATSASIQKADPDWSLLPGSTPLELRHLLQQCLEKDGKRRPQSASELRRKTESHSAPRSAWQRIAAVLAVIMLAGAALAAVLYWREPGDLRVEQTRQLTFSPELELEPALSPDGKMVAYVGGTRTRTDIYVRPLAGGDAILLTKDMPEEWHRWPRWSPDGAMIAFVSHHNRQQSFGARINTLDSVLRVVPSLGGTPRFVADSSGIVGHDWSPDGTRLVYVRDREIYVSALAGGAAMKITDAFEPHTPSWSPDGKWIAYTSGNALSLFSLRLLGNQAPSSIAIVAADGGEPRQLTDKNSTDVSPVWTPDSRSLLFVSKRGGSRDVFQLRLSDSGEAVGTPVRITTGLNALSIDLSRDGQQLSYPLFLTKANLWSIPIPESTPVPATAAKPLTTGSQMIEGISVSRDGAWIAFDSNRSGNSDIYRMRHPGGKLEQLTTDSHDDFAPSWSPDGQTIAFHSFRNGNRDIYVMANDGTAQEQITNDPAQERYPDWSPDGNSIVFHSNKTGREELYIVSKQNGGWGQPRQLTRDGGVAPHWSPDARLISFFFRGLFVISPDGHDAKLVVPHKPPLLIFYNAWAPDSRTIYFKADEPDSWSFWSVPAHGGNPKLLIRFGDPSRSSERYEFAASSKEFFFTMTERESDIWVLQLRK